MQTKQQQAIAILKDAVQQIKANKFKVKNQGKNNGTLSCRLSLKANRHVI